MTAIIPQKMKIPNMIVARRIATAVLDYSGLTARDIDRAIGTLQLPETSPNHLSQWPGLVPKFGRTGPANLPKSLDQFDQ